RLGYLLLDVDGGEIESLQRRNDQDQKGDRNQPLAFLRTAEDDERGEHETRRAEQHVDDRQRPRSELARISPPMAPIAKIRSAILSIFPLLYRTRISAGGNDLCQLSPLQSCLSSRSA